MKQLLLLGLGLVCTTVQAQSIRAGYYGETITHYGLKVAYERPLYTYFKERKQARKMFLFAPGLAVYRHPANHVGLIIAPELGYRRVGRRGGLFEVALSPSYFRYFLEGKSYEVGSDGEFRPVRLAGRSTFLPTISLGIGRDLSVRRNIALSWYARVNVMQQRPYNTSTLTRFGIEAGIIKPLKKS